MLQTQDAVLASKRKDAPHIVAPIRRYATSKLAHSYLDTLHQEHGGSAAAATQPDNIIRRPEFLIHHDVVSALLTQVSRRLITQCLSNQSFISVLPGTQILTC